MKSVTTYKGVALLGKENPDGYRVWATIMRNRLNGSLPVGKGKEAVKLVTCIEFSPEQALDRMTTKISAAADVTGGKVNENIEAAEGNIAVANCQVMDLLLSHITESAKLSLPHGARTTKCHKLLGDPEHPFRMRHHGRTWLSEHQQPDELEARRTECCRVH